MIHSARRDHYSNLSFGADFEKWGRKGRHPEWIIDNAISFLTHQVPVE